ncbi:hypothetical protein F5Y00DRAFT_266187 [Daldinia vernicosa]|uniref:uncharacterized protein n=1 Tax=Daldinia vernicosa TaxID=114800 RepID=UPI002008A11C|nr:uncharacterized protein F5Y00DRAFT_266187 [Daldinia vernicosa]KAI0844866.1 hypothetical protein F5Y00DRAFT_266187 [Daldinia vernicosa]
MSEITQLNREDPTIRPVSRVYQWLLDTSQEDDECRDGIITRLFNAGHDLYTALMRASPPSKTLSKSLYRQLQSGYSHYIVWARDYDVESGGLDSLLQNSRQLYTFVVEILVNTCVALRDVQDTSESSDSESDTSSDENQDSNENLQNTIETLLTEIECLLDLGPRLEEPVFDCYTEEQTASLRPPITSGPARHFVDIVLTKFPKCDIDLAIALGQANWDSTLRLQEKRNVTITLESPHEIAVHKPATIFQDSGPGSSLPKRSLCETTILSSNGGDVNGDEPTGARIPPLPSEREVGQFFSCMICGEHIKKQNTRVWKRHLLSDLQPWICCQIACPCDRKPFETRGEWVEHLYKGHKSHPEWDDKTCPLCLMVINEGGITTLSHLSRHLEEISLAALPCYPEDDDDDEDEDKSIALSLGIASMSQSSFDEITSERGFRWIDPRLSQIEQLIKDPIPSTNVVDSTSENATETASRSSTGETASANGGSTRSRSRQSVQIAVMLNARTVRSGRDMGCTIIDAGQENGPLPN